MVDRPWPSELRLSPDKATFTVAFENGDRFALAAEYLRVESPSAEVQGHAADQKQIVPGKHGVKIAALEPVVGSYCPGLARMPYHVHRYGARAE